MSEFVDLLDKEMYELEIDCLKRELEAHKKGKQELCKEFGVYTIAQLKEKFKNLPKQICDEIRKEIVSSNWKEKDGTPVEAIYFIPEHKLNKIQKKFENPPIER